jgi:hypothetical protein
MTATRGAAFAADATRQLLTLATGVLAVTVTFRSDLVPDPSTATTVLMALGRLALLLCILAGVLCLFGLTSEVARAEAERGGTGRASIRVTPVLVAGQVQALAFLAGLVQISVAATLSMT